MLFALSPLKDALLSWLGDLVIVLPSLLEQFDWAGDLFNFGDTDREA